MHHQRPADRRLDAYIDRHTARNAFAPVALLKFPPHCRIIGLPHDRAAGDRRQIHIPAAKRDFQPFSPDAPDRKNPPTLFILLGMPFIKNHPIAGLQVAARFDQHALSSNPNDSSHAQAPAFGKARVHQLLMIHAPEKPVGESARETLRKLPLPLAGEGELPRLGCRIDRRAVRLRGCRHVMRALQPSFDLEAADAERGEIGDDIMRREILRAEQVSLIAEIAHGAIDAQLIRQPAGLRALAAVGAAPA